MRKDNYNDTEEICQIRGGCRSIYRHRSGGNWEQFPRAKATDDDNDGNESRIQRGLEIAPVSLNLEGKNRALVGLGSYIVNAHVPAMSATAPAPRSISSFLAAIPTLANRR